ncbi:lysine exporter LysO family protein [Celerinatantimonas sp. YJH-8]|uniref:lysine exporter LysO family protein n=1 Tax=Celerinatantimonas sp. YJH-8 TaxID=3228714 RepID=UPI0038C7CF3E
MLFNIVVILAPLFLGYLFHIRSLFWLKKINVALSAMVYIILLLMGYNLAFIDNLADNLTHLATITLVFIGLLGIFNLAAFWLCRRWLKIPTDIPNQQRSRFSPALLKDSFKLVGLVLLGLGLGVWGGWHFAYQDKLSDQALMLLLFLIGLQLRASNLSLRQILLDYRGILIALVVFLSGLPAAWCAAQILDIPTPLALALSSGFGWYSLSGILISGQVNALMGSSAFFIDLLREMLALFLIPLLMPKAATGAIGFSGATAMDFTLPVIAKNGGQRCVPIAIVSGFLLSLACPALIAIWLSLYH